jgi:hypothetical protein
MNPLIQLKRTTAVFLVVLMLACFGLSPRSQAVITDPEDYFPGGNTGAGQNALLNLRRGQFNTAIGLLSLTSLGDGMFNTGVGAGTLLANIGENNTAIGAVALVSNTTGEDNTANGAFALSSNTTAGENTAIGFGALQNNTEGGDNTATGFQTLLSNTGGEGNTAFGAFALTSNTTGVGNNAFGYVALSANTTGSFNTALGVFAGGGVTTASHVICIGSRGADVNNSTWIANVYGVTTQSGTTAPVVVSDGGQLGTVASSQRFKKDIANMENASEMILSLRPVTFHYKSDVKGFPQFGLIAEEVAKVNPALVLPDKEGKPYSVRYDAVNAMLLNEFLKQHRKLEEVTKDFQAINQRLSEQDAKIQRVSAELQLRRQAPQTVSNDQ